MQLMNENHMWMDMLLHKPTFFPHVGAHKFLWKCHKALSQSACEGVAQCTPQFMQPL